MRILIFILILIAVVDGITKLFNLGWPKLIICILILAPVLIYPFRIEGMPLDKRGRPILFGLLMAIPTAVFARPGVEFGRPLQLGSDLITLR